MNPLTTNSPDQADQPRKKLPIGIQTLSTIIQGGYYYVDKTGLIQQLLDKGNYYFLSRPRRFGKSLLIDTLKELFEGNQALFAGLAIHDQWDWTVRYPVIRLSFGAGVLNTIEDLKQVVHRQLEQYEQQFGLPARYPDQRGQLRNLINRLHQQSGQKVVVLVDEYDKPILDAIDNPALALEIRDALKDMYCVIKDSDAHIRFAMLTGVSRFGKTSLSNSVDNLNDITLDPGYSGLCGFTEVEVDDVFAPELSDLNRNNIRQWYSGYNWRGITVYNPSDLLMLFDRREFHPWWFESGTPSFLVKLAAKNSFFTPELNHLKAGEELTTTFEGSHFTPESLLFQTGYLTLHQVEQSPSGKWHYTLKYPNREAEISYAMLEKSGARFPGIHHHHANLSDLQHIVEHGGI